MPEKQRSKLRKKCLRDLFSFCRAVMGYDDISPELHGDFCHFLEGPQKRKQTTMPRSFVKTWIGSIAYPIWATLKREEEDELPWGASFDDKFWQLGPNMRVLIASYVISNAEKMISLIRKTYEANTAMQILFPEVIPHNFNKVKWSNQSACINRDDNFTESTFEAAGIGGASTSRHYDLIIEDDLIYAKKDDLSDRELQPNQDDIDKAIGWHKLATSLLVPGQHTRMQNSGTRWAPKDLVKYIWDNEPSYARFMRGCVNLDELETGLHWKECTPEWPSAYNIEQLEIIAAAQGPYMFATQYLLKPTSPQQRLFQRVWLQEYTKESELPLTMRVFTTVDLAGWGKAKRSRMSRAVILTCGWDHNNHVWLLHYDVGRFDPSEVINIMAKHWSRFSPEQIGVEEVYYQKAIAHFARKAMERGDIPWMSIRAVKPEGGESKELRIRSIEPIASNLAVHCRPLHKEFIEEFCEYVPNNDSCTKDILDALAYQIRIARPGEVTAKTAPKNSTVVNSVDDFLEWAWSRKTTKDSCGNPGVLVHPFSQNQENDMLLDVTNPFADEDIV